MSKKALRVCFATSEYPPDWGGISRSSRRIVKMLVAGGHEVHVFKPALSIKGDGSDPFKNSSAVDGARLYQILTTPASISDPVSAALNFIRAIEQVDRVLPFDIFHGFYLPMAYPCLMVAQKSGRPVIASIRGDDGVVMFGDNPFREIVTEVLRKATWVTSVSRDSLQRARSIIDISHRSSFISNSTDGRVFPKWEPTEANSGVVGTVCTFRPKKNIPLLIQSYSDVHPEIRRKLLLVGAFTDQATKISSLNLIRKYDIQSETEITGYVDNSAVPRYLLSMHTFVLSSTHEGLPNTIIEAAATGIPIVATAVDGVKDTFMDGQHALLVPSGDNRELTAAIESVLRDEKLSRKLSAGSLEIAEQFRPEVEMKAWFDLYQNVSG